MPIPGEVLSKLEEDSTMWSKIDWIDKIRDLSRTYSVIIDAYMLRQLDQVVPGSGSKDEMLYAFAYFGVSNYLYRMG